MKDRVYECENFVSRIRGALVYALAFFAATGHAEKSLAKQALNGSDGSSITFSVSEADVVIEYRAPELNERGAVYAALGTHRDIGSAVIPFQQGQEGSTVFLPFKADRLVCAKSARSYERKWEQWKWSPSSDPTIKTNFDNGVVTFRISRSEFGQTKTIDCAVYAKDLPQNDGWGKLFGSIDSATEPGIGDRYISHYAEINLGTAGDKFVTTRARLGGTKFRIYQLFVRLFGNTNETRKEDGTLAENGVGKFSDINDAALNSLHALGFTHIWLTGVLQQATATDYSSVGQPADDPDLLKGLAGSPYAIKDYFDVCPDYAMNPAKRLDEFKALIDRIHKHGLKALIDFVPNHVARSYNSDVESDLNFGSKGNDRAGDDTSVFFSPKNNFFYLTPNQNGPPLHLPTMKDGKPVSPTCKLNGIKCDGLFDGEMKLGRVTGNNKASWTPDINDWYETVKLNYGFDFTSPDKREYPNANTPEKAVPDTWKKMDRVLAHWQSLGVDGFRCDMSHMVPPEFWNWTIANARTRRAEVVFIGEAYNNDPAKVPGVDPVISKLHEGKSNVMFDLLDAGFTAVYDDPTYRAINKIFEGPGWANDIDDARAGDFIFENSLRYSENHDEVRLAAKSQWNGVGMRAGPAICAILYGLSRGPIMLYNGQEVGEPAEGIEGFGGDDARTSIFDYWSMPEMVKWVNGHTYDGGRLSNEQKHLREAYGRLINLLKEPAFQEGIFVPLNSANRDNPKFGRLPNEDPSGHWCYAFLRIDPASSQKFLVIANLNPTATLTDVRVQLPAAIFQGRDRQARVQLTDHLNSKPLADATSTVGLIRDSGIAIAEIPPLTAAYLEIRDE